MRCWLTVGGLLFAMAMVSVPVRAQGVAGEVSLADVLEILVVDRELLAIDAAGGGQTVARLRMNETVVWKGLIADKRADFVKEQLSEPKNMP